MDRSAHWETEARQNQELGKGGPHGGQNRQPLTNEPGRGGRVELGVVIAISFLMGDGCDLCVGYDPTTNDDKS